MRQFWVQFKIRRDRAILRRCGRHAHHAIMWALLDLVSFRTDQQFTVPIAGGEPAPGFAHAGHRRKSAGRCAHQIGTQPHRAGVRLCQTPLMIQVFFIGIGVTDLDRSIRFYTRGARVRAALSARLRRQRSRRDQASRRAIPLRDADPRRHPDRVVAVVDADHRNGERKPMTEFGFTHLSFRVEDVDG